MTRLLLLLAALTAAGCSANPAPPSAAAADTLRSYPATDARIRVMGRHRLDDGGAVDFAASGVTFFLKFRGPALDAEMIEQSGDATAHNWFTVVVDGGEPSRFRTGPGRSWYALASGLGAGEHTLALSKATEGQNGHDRLVAVRTTQLLLPDPLPDRKIELIGNSITSGFGLDARDVACGKGTWYDEHHAWLAYGPRLARRLDAQWMLSSVSGIGMHRNWNSPGPVMPRVYDGVYMEYADTTTSWDFRQYTPDLVVVALGTNDFSAGDGATPRPELDGDAFVADYTAFLARVRRNYPRARMLLLNSPVFDASMKARLAGYLQRVIDDRLAAGDSAIAAFTFKGQYGAGCSGHPDLAEHLRMTDELEPVVKALMGW